MAWTKIEATFRATGAIVLAAGIATIITMSPAGSFSQGKLRLPVGKGTPAVSLGEQHGLVLASDGSLWSWGSDFLGWPVLGLGTNTAQTRLRLIGHETNWGSISAGTSHNVAIKSDGTLWTWGRHAHVYTESQNPALDATPTRVGTNGDWRSIAACGLRWCQGLTKKDGSLWLMDASDFDVNRPHGPNKAVRFRRVELQKDVVAYTAGAAHITAPGGHLPIGVALTRDGEVWTWGMMLGDPRSLGNGLAYRAVKLANGLGYKGEPPDATPVIRQTPWQLPHAEPDDLPKQ